MFFEATLTLTHYFPQLFSRNKTSTKKMTAVKKNMVSLTIHGNIFEDQSHFTTATVARPVRLQEVVLTAPTTVIFMVALIMCHLKEEMETKEVDIQDKVEGIVTQTTEPFPAPDHQNLVLANTFVRMPTLLRAIKRMESTSNKTQSHLRRGGRMREGQTMKNLTQVSIEFHLRVQFFAVDSVMQYIISYSLGLHVC